MEDQDLYERVYIDGQCFFEYFEHTIYGTRTYQNVAHTHPSLEISMVQSGHGTYKINGNVYDIQPGDIFIINNVEEHGIELSDKEHLVHHVLHFEPRFVWSDPKHFDMRYLKIFFERNRFFKHQLERDNETTREIQNIFIRIGEELKNRQPEYDLMVKVKLLNILVLLLRHYSAYVKVPHENGHGYEIEIIKRVTDYIDGHYQREIQLKELAEIALMNSSYFSTFFKRFNGLTPSEYIMRKRISFAMSQLRATDSTVLEIALSSGFNNIANFNKAFKKITGLTPTSFRKNQQPNTTSKISCI